MNAKSKILGLLVAIGLSLSIVSVAAADDSENVSVELVDSTTPCGISLYASSGNSFGQWDYFSVPGDYEYDSTPGSVTLEFLGDVDVYSMNGCDVTISFSGLSGPGGTIGPSHFSAYSISEETLVNPASFSHTGIGAGSYYYEYDFSYTLKSVPTIEPGTYTGKIDATISNTP